MKFLVLTKSAKNKGDCIAGIDLDTYQFVRLVSDKDGNAIPSLHYIEPLSVLNITGFPVPLQIQTENFLLQSIDSQIEPYDLNKLDKICNHIKNTNLLFFNQYYISSDSAQKLRKSLMIAEVSNFCTYNTTNSLNQPKTKAKFYFMGRFFDSFSITDRDYFNKECNYNKCKIILSISEKPYNDKHYIFIAKVFPLNEIDDS